MTPTEAIHISLCAIEEHLAGALGAVEAQADAQEAMAVSVDSLQTMLGELAGKVGQLYDVTRELNERLGNYLTEQAKNQSGVRVVQERLRAVERKIGL